MKKVFSILTIFLLGITSWSCSDDYDDSALWKEINELKAQVEKLNSDLSKIQATVSNLESGKYVTDYTKIENGCTLTFNDGSTVTIEHGKAGVDAPVVGIKESNGVYYWTLTADGEESWLMTPAPDNKMIPVSGKTPVMGVDADGFWTVDGAQVKDANNNPVKAGADAAASIFTESEETDDTVTLTLASGEQLVLPKVGKLAIKISIPYAEFAFGQQQTFVVAMNGVEKTTFIKPDGWKVDLTDNILTVMSPVEANTYADTAGVITIIGMKGNSSCMAELKVACGKDGKVEYSTDGGATWSETAPAANTTGDLLIVKSTFGAAMTAAQIKKDCGKTKFKAYDLSDLFIADADAKNAFWKNTTVTSVILPKRMTHLPDGIFIQCTSLTDITFPPYLTRIGNNCFEKCTFSSFTVPEGVEIIGNNTFKNLSLESVKLPSTLKSIGEGTFAGMNTVTKIEIPEGVTQLGKMMFYFNPGFGYGSGTSHLQEVVIPSTVTDWQMGPGLSAYWFYGCSSLQKIICYVATPVEANTDETWGDFKDVPSTCVVYVPDASVDAYKATAGWQNFTIKGISELQ